MAFSLPGTDRDREWLPFSPVILCGTIVGMTPERARKYRLELLAALDHLDQLVTEADAVLADPGDTDDHPLVGNLRKQLTEMRATVEYKIDVPTQ
jgi:hypothetical protein